MKTLVRTAITLLCIGAAVPVQARIHRPNVSPQPAPSAGPAFLGSIKDWSAYSRGGGDSKVCYALSEPKAKEPARVKRDKAYFLINDWPGRHSRSEAEIVPGYRYRDGSTVDVKIGRRTFAFFTKNAADAGSAWLLNPEDQPQLLRALQGGVTVVVTGISRRGTVTKDIYGLSGFGDALAKIHHACGM
jgi:hypothetical protein